MRFEDLAVRLVAVEAKLATLTGTAVNTDSATSIEELDARLTLVEVTLDHLIAVKTQEHVDSIVAAVAVPVEHIEEAVAEVVALSPSAEVPAAAEIVAEVVQAQVEADPVAHEAVADIVSAAVQAVVAAEPEVVINTVAITEAIIAAVADAPVPTVVGRSIANVNICAPGNDVVWLYAGNMSSTQWDDTLLITSGYTWSAPEAQVTSGTVITGANHDGIYHIAVADASGTAIDPTSGKVYTFYPPTEAPAPAPEVVQQIVDAIVEVIAAATGVEEVAPEVIQQVTNAVTTPADPALDNIEARLYIAEAKVDALLSK